MFGECVILNVGCVTQRRRGTCCGSPPLKLHLSSPNHKPIETSTQDRGLVYCAEIKQVSKRR